MSKITIVRKIAAQGSFGIWRTNPRTSEIKGPVVNVWHVLKDGVSQARFETREHARTYAHAARNGVV